MESDRFDPNGRPRTPAGEMSAHRGDLVGPQGTRPASGAQLSLRSADSFRVRDGTIVAHRVSWDQADLAAQLGAAPR